MQQTEGSCPTHIEVVWTELMDAAAWLIALDPKASSFARRDAACLVAIWPDAAHDLDNWSPRSVVRLTKPKR